MNHQGPAFILYFLKNFLWLHVGGIGGEDRIFWTDLLTLVKDLMFDIGALKGCLDHKIGISDFAIIGGEEHVLEDGIRLFLFEDSFFSRLGHLQLLFFRSLIESGLCDIDHDDSNPVSMEGLAEMKRNIGTDVA